MGMLPDWFMNYGNKPGAAPFTSGPAMPPGSSPPRLPNWLMNYGNDPNAAQGAQYNDVDNVPYDPTTGPNNSSQAMRGAPGPDPMAGYVATMPPRRPASLSAPASAPQTDPVLAATAARAANPQAGDTLIPTSILPGGDDQTAGQYWTQEAQRSAATDGRQVGPGSWFDPAKMGKMIDPNSLIGKMMAFRNASPAPPAPQTPSQEGALSSLFDNKFNSSLTPNNTTGGLW